MSMMGRTKKRSGTTVGQVLGLAAFAVVGLLATGCAERSEADAQAGPRDDLNVTRGAFHRTLVLTGELVAEDGVPLITPNANIWPMQIRWLAEDGAEVRAGEPVVEIDNSQLASNLDEMRASVVEASNQLIGVQARVANAIAEAAYGMEDTRARLEKAQLEANVPRELFAAREYEERQLELRKAELDMAEAEKKLESARDGGAAEIRIQEVALARAERQVQRAESRIEALSLTAPRDGIFLRADHTSEGRPYEATDTCWPGQTVASIPDLSTLIVEAKLYDVDDGRVDVGMPVRAVLDAHSDRTYTGQVRSIDRLARQEGRRSSRRAFRVVATIDDLDLAHMRPGMSVRLEIDAASDDVLRAPRQALEWSPEGARAHRRDGAVAVTLGPCNATHCIVEAGLNEGDALVATPEMGS